jgi:hypothetical protein
MRRINTRDLVSYLLRHPDAIPVVARSAWRLRATSWWRHAPFLPLPDKHYWDFRMTTALGSAGVMRANDVVNAARWSDRQRERR